MKYLYSELLFPELYNCPKASKFIDALISPEIDSVTDDIADQFCQTIPVTDDLIEHIHIVSKLAIQKVKDSGTFPCFFVAFQDKKNPITLVSPTPTTKDEIRELLCAGKCLAFASRAQSIFFTSEVYHKNGEPILGQPIPSSVSWGIQIIGSSVRGNAFRVLIDIQELDGKLIFGDESVRISRERTLDYPFAHFFSISDEEEMSSILSQLPTLSQHYPSVTEQESIKNFAVIMKVLLKLGYNK